MATELHSVQHGTETAGESPYVGMAAFQPQDAEFFFGREEIVEELRESVRQRRFVGVFGASGSGKSSILRAGLVARTTTPVLLFAPGPRPLEECALQLAKLSGRPAPEVLAELAAGPENLGLCVRQLMEEDDLLIVVDQFEEVFTVADAGERARSPSSRTRVVLGVRADFHGHRGQHPELVKALRDNQILVGAMTSDELRAAITGPASHVGARVESALVTRLVAAEVCAASTA